MGLTEPEAERRLRQVGPNALPEERPRYWLVLLSKFWAPISWMLEAAIVLELVVGHTLQALLFSGLLVFNAVLSFVQEHRAQSALALLRQNLSVQARVRRDGRWQVRAAPDLVPGDVVHLRVGDLVPADVRVQEGQLSIDQSSLTGEALPVDVAAGALVYAGTTVRRGEATGEVTATGRHTAFGKTAELVGTARTAAHLEEVILRIVRALVGLDAALVALVLVYGLRTGLPPDQLLSFVLILLIASVPVALPATFTLATALGAQELARRGVLATRLSALEEAAGMDVLCTDKTGTLTRNQPRVGRMAPAPPSTSDDLLRLAALASDDATQDPIDLAILAAATARSLLNRDRQRLAFTPFDPTTKRTEALVRYEGVVWHVVKGTPSVVQELLDIPAPMLASEVAILASGGFRVLAVAAGPEHAVRLVGLLGLDDPPRPESAALIGSLRRLGVRVVLATGDTQATAEALAAQVDIGRRACPPEALRKPDSMQPLDCDVFAGVLPEDKFHLIEILQRDGHVVGMTGDGVNDAPALKRAEVGIAVSTATDVAKAAASLVLTQPGLANVVTAVEASRRIYQRMLTYALNKIIKTLQVAVFLSLALLGSGVFVTSPRLVVLLLFANDFVTMAIATDHVRASDQPERWHIRPLILSALALLVPLLGFSFGTLWLGQNLLALDLAQLQTLVFVMLVFTGQATVYLVRERAHVWHSRPSGWLIASSLADLAVVSLLATQGWLMTPILWSSVAAVLILSGGYVVVADIFKVRLFAHFGLATHSATATV